MKTMQFLSRLLVIGLFILAVGCQKDQPIASFESDYPTPCYAPCTVTFENKSSNATSYFWEFNDGSRSEVYSPTHTFQTPGTYTVTLTAENYGLGKDTHTETIRVEAIPPDPQPSFTFTPNNQTAPVAVAFTNTSKYASTYEWDFGDGSNPTSNHNPTHTYTTAGNFTAKLTATNSAGKDSVFTATVIVNANTTPPNASFTMNFDVCIGPCTISFTNTSNNPSGTSYYWNFGNGSTSSDQHPSSRQYNSPGNYTITLTASNSNGSTSTERYLDVQSGGGGGGPDEVKIDYITFHYLPNLTSGYYDEDGYPDVYAAIFYLSDNGDWIFDALTYYHEDLTSWDLPISEDGDPSNRTITHLDKLHEIRIYDYDPGSDPELMRYGQFYPSDHVNSNINFTSNATGELSYTLYLDW